ncbi:hypothetical protein [Amycolatopsis minnesotensis]|uniref:Uncharacterized protein n=1 Tax=Amycolatopsis minnesotensis TaxID=337894 RepID=A0ABP5CJ07_9PSEU
MSRIETRYRRLLRVLPAYYRQQWEEDMVATFLDSVAPGEREDEQIVAEYGWPSAAEARSVLALAARLRFGGTGAPRRYALSGAVVRRFALAGMLFHAATAMTTLVLRLAWPPEVVRTAPPVEMVLRFLWLPAFLALVTGRLRVTATAAGLATAAAVVAALTTTGRGFTAPELGLLVLDVLLVAAVAAFHRDAPPVRPRPWLIALPVTAVCAFAVEYAGLLGDAGVASALVSAVGVAFLCTRRVFAWRHDQAGWALTLAVLALAALGLRVLALPQLETAVPARSALLTAGYGETVVAFVVAVVLAVVAYRSVAGPRAVTSGTSPA